MIPKISHAKINIPQMERKILKIQKQPKNVFVVMIKNQPLGSPLRKGKNVLQMVAIIQPQRIIGHG